MRQSNINYPYPILIKGTEDYSEDCMFHIELNQGVKVESGNYHIVVSSTVISDGLNNMIKNGEASVIIQVVCPRTCFRRIYRFDNLLNDLDIIIAKGDLIDNVILNSYIVSNVNKDNFRFDEHNKIFKDLEIAIKCGDKLAIGNIRSFKLTPYDALRPIASIVSIKLNKNLKDQIDVNLTGDKIVIYMNQDMFKIYKDMRQINQLKSYLSISIVFPAIVEAIQNYKDNYDMGEDTRWKIIISKVIKNLGIDLIATDLSCYAIANKIFNNGIYTSLVSLNEFFAQD